MIITSNKSDFDTTLRKALSEIEPNYEDLNGIIITGSHAPKDVELKINLIKMARENQIPLLGICLGMQLMAVEYVRTYVKDANSEEVNPQSKNLVIVKMPELRVGMLEAIWQGNKTLESHWHNYKFNRGYENMLSMEYKLDYIDDVLDCMTLEEHPFMVGVQFHVEYQSSIDKPHPILVEFIKACKNNA